MSRLSPVGRRSLVDGCYASGSLRGVEPIVKGGGFLISTVGHDGLEVLWFPGSCISEGLRDAEGEVGFFGIEVVESGRVLIEWSVGSRLHGENQLVEASSQADVR